MTSGKIDYSGLDQFRAPEGLLKAIADAATYTQRGFSQSEALTSIADIAAEDLNDALEVRSKLQHINVDVLPGDTPIEKAKIYGALQEQIQEERKYWWDDPTPNSSKAQAEQVQAAAKAAKELADAEAEEGGTFGGEAMGLSGKTLGEYLETLSQQDAYALLGLATLRQLGFSMEKKKLRREDPEGDILEFEQISSFDDIPLISPEDLAAPDFALRLVNQEILIAKTYTKDKSPKMVYAIAVDRSGSMNTPKKKGIVKAALTRLFEHATKEKATVYITTFEVSVDEWKKVETREEALETIKNWPSPQGGNTEVGKIIKTTQEEIKMGRIGPHTLASDERPEIVVINDGQDRIEPITTVAPVHAIVIEAPNPALKRLCESSGGKYYEIK